MITVDERALIRRLNGACMSALEGAAGLAVGQACYEVCVEHLLSKLLEAPEADAASALRHYELDEGRVQRAIQHEIEQVRKGNSGRPAWSPLLIEWMQDAFMLAAVDMGARSIRSGHLLLAMLRRPGRYAPEVMSHLQSIPVEDLAMNFHQVLGSSIEEVAAAEDAAGPGTMDGGGRAIDTAGGESAIDRFTIDFTARARAGEIDPIFGRGREIRQMVDILARRRKNNPIVVGEAGVGKTALIEGLALQIVVGDAPASLANVRVLGLDLGLLQAGAGVKGEFEKRLHQVIQEVKVSAVPIVLFIDEAHTMIGSGGAQGGGDAANLLKPALARGELRTIAATTWSEYKKYFEKDAALSRRFQVVKLGEPTEEETVLILRGLAKAYEAAHGVHVRDEAVVACARLGSRYVAGRLHPDKGVDLLDTAGARVKLSHSARPSALEELEEQRENLRREEDALRHEERSGQPIDAARVDELETGGAALDRDVEALKERWHREREMATTILELRRELASIQLGDAAPAADGDEADVDVGAEDPPGADEETIEEKSLAESVEPRSEEEVRAELDPLLADLEELQGDDPLIHLDVTAEAVAKVVSDWTGIPAGKMVSDDARAALDFEERLKRRIRGQDHALEALGRAIRDSKAGVNHPGAPIGVFFCVGPSGVGKTEAGLGLADTLFGGERFLTTINMSEFQEKHTVSRLIGSPPGYVGYGEGGRLTEAVRQRPYSVVLLDEVEKAHPDVMNLFYQVFDKGSLTDGEGREIDFKNTIIYMTSNLATDIITDMSTSGVLPTPEELEQAIRPVLSDHFKPALLARMTVVPFYPISPEIMKQIAVLKLGKLSERVEENHRIPLVYDDEVLDQIVARCTEVATGARNIDHLLRKSLMPPVSSRLLELTTEGLEPTGLEVRYVDGDFKVRPIDGSGELGLGSSGLTSDAPQPSGVAEVEA